MSAIAITRGSSYSLSRPVGVPDMQSSSRPGGADTVRYLVLALLTFGLIVSPPGPRAQGAGEPSFTIAVVGDSLADGMWGGLVRITQKDKRIKLFRGAKNSVGFTGGDLTDMVDRAFAAGETHALVMMIGANDRRSYFIDGKPKALFRTPGWAELYRGRVERFMDHAAKRNVPLVWILLPIMRAADATADAKLINDIVIEAAKTRPNVRLIETASITGDEKGTYLPHFKDLSGTVRPMRLSDGVHFEQPAYELFGDLVLKALKDASPRYKAMAAD